MSWLWRPAILCSVCCDLYIADCVAGTPKGVGRVVDGDVMKAVDDMVTVRIAE